jgi:predicted transcriptional regulator
MGRGLSDLQKRILHWAHKPPKYASSSGGTLWFDAFNEHGKRAMTEALAPDSLGYRSASDMAVISRALARLVKRNLIVRRTDDTKRRTEKIELTPDGREAVRRIRSCRT